MVQLNVNSSGNETSGSEPPGSPRDSVRTRVAEPNFLIRTAEFEPTFAVLVGHLEGRSTRDTVETNTYYCNVTELDECLHGLAPDTCSICLDRTRPTPPPRAHATSVFDGRKTPENSDDYFGHSWPEWFTMRDAGIAYISFRARGREMTGYHELWRAIAEKLGIDIGNPYRQEPWLLEYLSREFFEQTGLILSALVRYEEGDESPGEGFFRLAGILGVLAPEHVPEVGVPWKGMTPEQERFWREQVDGVYAHFANVS